jgi:hypothetical protein
MLDRIARARAKAREHAWKRRHLRNLTGYEKRTGWKYSITCTNIPGDGIPGVPGSHHPQYIDAVHRDHVTVETDGVRTAKAMGLRNLPSKPGKSTPAGSSPRTSRPTSPPGPASSVTPTTRNSGTATPDTLRYRIWHLPARLAAHARQRTLALSASWPWKEAFPTCWQRLCALPAPA